MKVAKGSTRWEGDHLGEILWPKKYNFTVKGSIILFKV